MNRSKRVKIFSYPFKLWIIWVQSRNFSGSVRQISYSDRLGRPMDTAALRYTMPRRMGAAFVRGNRGGAEILCAAESFD